GVAAGMSEVDDAGATRRWSDFLQPQVARARWIAPRSCRHREGLPGPADHHLATRWRTQFQRGLLLANLRSDLPHLQAELSTCSASECDWGRMANPAGI